ncbi:hypothetical protein BIU90_16590 [Curtobacterium sp. MCBA15_001]|nr:hypothetical protein BIU90_16590 [Curtobacterium sp. MCBA15_001]
MLLLAAALLTFSMHSAGVVEASVLPTAAPTVVVSGTVRTDDTVAGEHGRAFLDDLARLTPAQLDAADRDRRVVATAMDTPPTAAEVATWWAGLDSAVQAQLERSAPVVVGNLDGVPYGVRDRANRAVLAAGLAADPGDASERAMLGQVRDALHRDPGDPPKSLVTLDTRGAGRAAIAIGDLATAADVSVVVPGMFFTVTGQMPDFTATSGALYDEQATLAPVAAPGHGTGVAVLAWMGYRTPDLSNILSLDLAKTGAQRLERTVDGIRRLREGDQPRIGIVAHSYGSTTAMMALASGRMRADSLTVLGSPGSEVRSASQLAVAADQMFVGQAHLDPIAGSGYFGTDPAAASFGATVLDLSEPAPGTAGDLFRRPVGHNDYLKPGTASLHDVALIALGRGDLVRGGTHRSGGHDDGGVQPSFDLYLVRPQDLQLRD